MSWEDRADCRAAISLKPELITAWDNIDHGDKYLPDPQEAIAMRICDSCPVRELCLVDAVQDVEAEGVRGGFRFHMGSMTREESQRLYREYRLKGRVKRGRGRSYVEDFGV